MDRVQVFPGAIPLETDILSTNKNAMIGLSKLAIAMLGASTQVNGLACTPNSPAALNVIVGPGEIYSMQNIDSTAYSSLPADTAHTILKQGILLDAATLATPAPATAGQSINYLIQAAFAETDSGAVVLPYYNASNPSTAYSGPANAGTTNNTVRKGAYIVTAKAGISAATGSQTTPAPDAGYVGLYSVTVANGQATVVAGNIAQLSTALFISPAVMANAFTGPNQQKAVPGYQKLPGGFILQIGLALTNNANGSVTITLPTAYTGTGTYVVMATNTASSPPGSFAGINQTGPGTFVLWAASSGGVAVGVGAAYNWIALGY